MRYLKQYIIRLRIAMLLRILSTICGVFQYKYTPVKLLGVLIALRTLHININGPISIFLDAIRCSHTLTTTNNAATVTEGNESTS